MKNDLKRKVGKKRPRVYGVTAQKITKIPKDKSKFGGMDSIASNKSLKKDPI